MGSEEKLRSDFLVTNAAQVVTCAAGGVVPRCSTGMSDISVTSRGAVASYQGTIVVVGPEKDVLRQTELVPHGVQLDAGGGVIIPGLVECHTHMVFGGWRCGEFVKKLEGASYLDILESGGGILSSVRATRNSSREELIEEGLKRLDSVLSLGTTTCEIKTGYGLDLETEIKMLEVIAELDRLHPVDVVATFLGAHAVPPEYEGRQTEFLARLAEEVLPKVARRKLAEFCDIFCENRVFPADSAGPYLEKAKQLGFKIRLHADEIEPSGGAELAARLGARSADHLLKVSDAGIEALAEAGTTAVLLPGTGLFLGEEPAPARRLIDAGVPVALSTDFNPGSSPTMSLPLIVNLGCVLLKMTPAEALTAVTINAASVLDRAALAGSLEAGKKADMLLLDIPSWDHLAYRFGQNFVRTVIKNGRVVCENRAKIERVMYGCYGHE